MFLDSLPLRDQLPYVGRRHNPSNYIYHCLGEIVLLRNHGNWREINIYGGLVTDLPLKTPWEGPLIIPIEIQIWQEFHLRLQACFSVALVHVQILDL